jgi:purine nucleosidase
MVRLVVDTDPGVDDAQALMLASAHPNARIEAVTTVAGNVSLERTTANACVVLDALGVRVPVFAGAPRSLMGDDVDASDVHGSDGLGNTHFPPSARRVEAEHAALALVRLANESPGELDLVTLAPLTNVALAVALDPELPQKFRRLTIMGGAIRGQGNTIHPSAEFNVFTDPEAARMVLGAWPDCTLVSWETSMDHALDEAKVEKLLDIRSARADFFRAISAHTLAFVERALGFRRLIASDALAMAVAIEPDMILRSERRYVDVELGGAHTRGQTTVDWLSRTGQEANVTLALDIDRVRWSDLMTKALT